jgi:NAD(P)-dependent dehydrogenase (short-subunit alcohol dehydrogenase family)
VFSSSSVGSITRQPRYKDFPAAAYKITKAALNMLTVVWAQELAKEGFTVISQNPGVSGAYLVIEMLRARKLTSN